MNKNEKKRIFCGHFELKKTYAEERELFRIDLSNNQIDQAFFFGIGLADLAFFDFLSPFSPIN